MGDPLRGSKKLLPAPVAIAVFLLKASEPHPISFYPEHFEGEEVSHNLHSFCFPGNLAEINSSSSPLLHSNPCRQWEYHNFILTSTENYRTYGHCLRFSMNDGNRSSVILDHAICVLSWFPFFDAFKAWLAPIVSDMLSSSNQKRISVEPRISALIHETIAIRSNNIKSILQLESAVPRSKPLTCSFQLAGDSSCLPPLDFNMSLFLSCVNPATLITIFEVLLSAGQILFVSSRASLLTLGSQACLSLIWPLSWDFAIYIPVYPKTLSLDALGSPNASIFGILKGHPELPSQLEETFQYNDALVIVDLDDNRILIGEGCRYNRLPNTTRDKFLERLRMILNPKLLMCDIVNPDDYETTADHNQTQKKPKNMVADPFSSPSIPEVTRVRIAFMLLLRDLCDSSQFETEGLGEFKAAFLASPIYTLYQRNATEVNLLKKLKSMSEEQATSYLIDNYEPSTSQSGKSKGGQTPYYNPPEAWIAKEAPLQSNEAVLPVSGLSFSKSNFPSPNQRANEMFRDAEKAYLDAKARGAPQSVISDWIMVMVGWLLKLKKHHECLKLVSELEPEHPIFLCGDFLAVLLESLSVQELDAMAMRQSGDRLGDAARQFRETKARQQSTTLSAESKELYQFIMTQEDYLSENKLIELVTNRLVNVNATPQGVSLLNTAVSMGKLRMAAILLRYNASPDQEGSKNTIAHSLCATKPRDEVSYLLGIRILCLALAKGLNINRGDNLQATALSNLCSRPVPSLPLMYFLLHNGADTHSRNVDGNPASHFVVKTRMEQLADLTPLVFLLDMGTNPMLTESGASTFKALVTAASDAVTNHQQPFAVLMENNKYLTAKYALLRVFLKNDKQGTSSITSTPVIPPLPNLASLATTTTEAGRPPISPKSGAPISLAIGTGTGIGPGSLVSSASSSTIVTKPRFITATTSDGPSTGPQTSLTSDKPIPSKLTEVHEHLSIANYAVVEAQYRQLAILSTLVHRYLKALAKRKRKGIIIKRKAAHFEAALALTTALQNLLNHHTTLCVDIRHHLTMNGSKPTIATCFSGKIGLISEAHTDYNTAFYENDCFAHLDALNADDMSELVQEETEVLSALVGSFSSAEAAFGKLLVEVLEFPVKLSVLFEELLKKASLANTPDLGKIQVLLSQMENLRGRLDRRKYESQLRQVLEEIGAKVSGIPQFSSVFSTSTSLLTNGTLKLVKNMDAPGLTKIQPSELLSCKAYLFATGDDNENKGYLLLSAEGSSTEKKRIPMKKMVVFDVPAFHYTPGVITSSTPVTSHPIAGEATLSHPIALVAMHPTSAPHDFFLLECPSAEAKTQWLSLLWRVCFEGRNLMHKRHLYEYFDRSSHDTEYEGWLDYQVENEHTNAVVTHYFTLKSNKLVAHISATSPIPVVIIYLDEYYYSLNEESKPHTISLIPNKHLAPCFILHFGEYPKVLTKYPQNTQHYDWKHVLKSVVTPKNSPKM